MENFHIFWDIFADHNDHESSFSLTVTDPPVSSSQMKRSILEGINDSIEESREGTAAETCITPGEIPLTEGEHKS